MQELADTLGVSQGVAIAIVVVGVVQVIIQIYALIDLVRRPAVTGGMKWVWVLAILFGNLLGAVLYLAIGRSAPPVDDTSADIPERDARDRAASTVDVLYGKRNTSTDGDRQ